MNGGGNFSIVQIREPSLRRHRSRTSAVTLNGVLDEVFGVLVDPVFPIRWIVPDRGALAAASMTLHAALVKDLFAYLLTGPRPVPPLAAVSGCRGLPVRVRRREPAKLNTEVANSNPMRITSLARLMNVPLRYSYAVAAGFGPG